MAQHVGLDFVGLLSEDEYYAAIRDPDLWHPTKSFSVVARRLILPALRIVYDTIQKNFKPGRTVVAAPGFAFGARIAQEKLGVPLATVHLQPIMLRSAIRPACFAELGLPPVRRLFDRWFHSPQRVVGLFPEWFAPPMADWPPNIALTGFPLWDEGDLLNPSAELEEFLAAGDPPLVFTAGSAMVQANQFFHVSAEVCRAAGRRGLLLTQFPEQLPASLPNGVCHFDYLPFSMVLPRCAALVHHGGIGTTAQAIAAGIPQLVVPTAHDQPDNAVRIRRLGIGDFILPEDYTSARVAEKLGRLTNPVVKDNCQRRAADLAGRQSLEKAADLIEGLAIR